MAAGRPSLFRPAILLILAIFLAACSRQGEHVTDQKVSVAPVTAPSEEKAASVTVKPKTEQEKHRDELMRAIFQNAYRPERGSALSEIEHAKGKTDKFLMTIVSTVELADKRTVVVANAMPSDDDGNEQFGHGSPGLLNVYFLHRVGGKWEVLERRENIGAMGTNGYIGSVEWIELAPGRPGFILTSGGTWQGYNVGFDEVYDLADGIRSLGGLASHSDNTGACTEQTDECWEVSGTLRFVEGEQPNPYRDILVDFAGKKYTVTEGKDGRVIEHPKASVKETARYRFDGKKYELISGTNPVPDV